MKIEMGESLFYSWLRHVKECQVVQTNWKASPQWTLEHNEDLQEIMTCCAEYFETKYGYKIFKKNSSLSQILQQGEIDAVGVYVQDGKIQSYAVDVAFHEGGLNYGTKEATVSKVIAKSVRSAMLLYGYINSKDAEIIFASPKINPSVLKELLPCIQDLNGLFAEKGFSFQVRIIANDDFNSSILQPILLLSGGIADTAELFLRSYQMYTMFADAPRRYISADTLKAPTHAEKPEPVDGDIYRELKIGQLANIVLRDLLQSGAASEAEVGFMQQAEYSKQFFGLNHPLLAKVNTDYNPARYYSKQLVIRGETYALCNDWYENVSNNDRPYLLKWINEHNSKI